MKKEYEVKLSRTQNECG